MNTFEEWLKQLTALAAERDFTLDHVPEAQLRAEYDMGSDAAAVLSGLVLRAETLDPESAR